MNRASESPSPEEAGPGDPVRIDPAPGSSSPTGKDTVHFSRGADVETPKSESSPRPLSASDSAPRILPEASADRIGRYRLFKPLGRGGFGTVHLAFDEVLHRQVAVKIPREELVREGEARRQFLEEARMAARLRHPGIVVVHDFGVDEQDRCFVVYEYVPGESLQQRITGEPWPVAKAVELVARIAEALHAAHKQGLVHRDLKPSNILLDGDQPRITDFGLAVDESSQRALRGEVAGTPAYMAPEQLRGEVHYFDGRTDLWALGVILYELLTGRRPFRAESRDDLIDEILEREVRPPRQTVDGIPRQIDEICRKCLAKPITERYASAIDLAEDLRSAPLEGSSRQAIVVQPQPDLWGVDTVRQQNSRERARTNRWVPATVVALASLVAVAGICGLIWFNFKNHGNGTADVPHPSPPPPQPNVWQDLLNERPKPLVWFDQPTSRWEFTNHQLHVKSNAVAMFQLGTTSQKNFSFRVRIQQPVRSGNVGLFWGYSDLPSDSSTVQFQLLKLTAFKAEDRTRVALQRDLVLQMKSGDQKIVGTERVSAANVELNGENPFTLRIEVHDGRLKSVGLDGSEFPSLIRDHVGESRRPHAGLFGVSAERCSPDFQSASFQYTP